MMRRLLSLAVWLFFGAIVHLILFGEPIWTHVGSWAVIVFWPAVLLWYAIWWGIAALVVILAICFVVSAL